MARSRIIVFTLAAALTAGCGFHLRRPPQLPAVMSQTYIEASDQGSDLVRAIRQGISTSNAAVVDDATTATAIIHILQDQGQERVLSVDNRGRPEEYELTYVVQFSVTAGKNQLIEPQTLHLQRNYAYSPEDPLGSQKEAQLLLTAMKKDMAELVLRRLEAAGHVSAEPAK